MRSFLEAVQGDRLEALYVLAISTGMRQGELLGLRGQDVDVERRRLQLVRQLKTRQSRRAVVLSELAVTALVDHRERQAAEREQQGSAGRARPGLSQHRRASRWTRTICGSGASFHCLIALACPASASTTCGIAAHAAAERGGASQDRE